MAQNILVRRRQQNLENLSIVITKFLKMNAEEHESNGEPMNLQADLVRAAKTWMEK